MRRFLAGCVVAAMAALVGLTLTSSPASAVEFYLVTSDADSGPGSLREALDLADSDYDDSVITIAPDVEVITVSSQLLFDLEAIGTEDPWYSLTILGGGVTIERTGAFTPLRFDDTRDVTIKNLTVDGDGADLDGIELYPDAAGADIVIHGVTIVDNAGYGVYIDQQAGSGFTLYVDVADVTSTGNGSTGLYVDPGDDVDVTVTGSTLNGNGDEGLDVNGSDNVSLDIADSNFDGNGDEGLRADTDDGSIDATISGSSFDGNDDDGFALRASGTGGDVDATITDSHANDNGDEGFYLRNNPTTSETSDISFRGVLASGNQDNGLRVKGFSSLAGLNLSLVDTDATNNGAGGGGHGLEVVVDASNADLDLSLANSGFVGNATDGVYVNGNVHDGLYIHAAGSVFRGNGADGMNLQDFDTDLIDLTAAGSRFVDNGDDGLRANAHELRVTLTSSEFSDNGSDGANLTDDNGSVGGDVTARVVGSSFHRNGGDGFDIDEFDDAGVSVQVMRSGADDNGGDGYEISENGSGSTTAIFLLADANGNADTGVAAPGSGGIALLLLSDFTGNSNGPWDIPDLFVIPIGS